MSRLREQESPAMRRKQAQTSRASRIEPIFPGASATRSGAGYRHPSMPCLVSRLGPTGCHLLATPHALLFPYRQRSHPLCVCDTLTSISLSIAQEPSRAHTWVAPHAHRAHYHPADTRNALLHVSAACLCAASPWPARVVMGGRKCGHHDRHAHAWSGFAAKSVGSSGMAIRATAATRATGANARMPLSLFSTFMEGSTACVTCVWDTGSGVNSCVVANATRLLRAATTHPYVALAVLINRGTEAR